MTDQVIRRTCCQFREERKHGRRSDKYIDDALEISHKCHTPRGLGTRKEALVKGIVHVPYRNARLTHSSPNIPLISGYRASEALMMRASDLVLCVPLITYNESFTNTNESGRYR